MHAKDKPGSCGHHQFFYARTHFFLNLSTFQPFNPSTFQPFNFSTRHRAKGYSPLIFEGGKRHKKPLAAWEPSAQKRVVLFTPSMSIDERILFWFQPIHRWSLIIDSITPIKRLYYITGRERILMKVLKKLSPSYPQGALSIRLFLSNRTFWGQVCIASSGKMKKLCMEGNRALTRMHSSACCGVQGGSMCSRT